MNCWQGRRGGHGRPIQIVLSEYGKIVDETLQLLHKIYDIINVDKYVNMANHIHMILLIDIGHVMRTPSISTVINQFKGYISKQIGFSLWQKLFHNRIILDEEEYSRV